MTSFALSIAATFQIWAYNVTNVDKLSKTFRSLETIKFLKKSPDMRLIPVSVEDL